MHRSFRNPTSRALSSIFALVLVACSGATGTTGEGGDDVGNGDDTGANDTGASDTGAGDTGVDDTGADDTGAADTGADDTGADDTGADDTGVLDTGSDTGPADTGAADTGFPNCTIDSDGDTIFDETEGRFDAAGPRDTDKDGTPDYLDLDSDDDGIPDSVEWVDKSCDVTASNDADGDGTPNFEDLDSDGNGLLDHDEACPPAAVLTKLGMAPCASIATPYDFDLDTAPDYLDTDNDHDSASGALEVGLEDKYELRDNAGTTYLGLAQDQDGDGVPDLYDRDADDDNIFDLEDGLADVDKDGAPGFRDLDSDGDKVPDACEARANANYTPSLVEATKALFDTDKDGKPDFIDLDTDGDLLVDGKEDLNGNCLVDATETNRLKGDTDGDGVSDLVEVSLIPGPKPGGSVICAQDPTCTPDNQGKFWFLEPYSADGSQKPTPASSPLALSTTLNQGDVAFVIDTTTSMDGIESNLASSIASRIIPALSKQIPDLELGVIGYDDALAKPWGDSTGDSFIWFPNGYATGSAMGTSTDAISAAAKLTHVSPGGSYPEGSVPAMWWVLTGDAFTFKSCTTCTPANPATTKTFAAAPSPGSGQFGGLHFRSTALPIVINTSDANFHGGLTTGCNVPAGQTAIPNSLCFPIAYTTDGAVPTSLGHSPSIAELLAKMNAVGAKYIGVSVHGPGGSKSADPNRTLDASYYASAVDMLYLARGTGSKVAPSVLGGSGSDCKTENAGATANPADPDGQCPLVFDITYGGTGLGDIVVNGVVSLLQGLRFDVHVQAIPILSGSVDPVNAFMQNVLPYPAGGITDPVTGGKCVAFPSTQTADKYVGPKATPGVDGQSETITQLNPGPLYCFNVVPKPNVSVAATTSTQIFHATLRVLADRPAPPAGPGGEFTLGSDHDVIFIVPPIVN